MVQKEKASLWRIKHLLTRLSGDNTWLPCESVETDNDIVLFYDERERHQGSRAGKAASKDEADHLSTGTLPLEDAAQNLITDGQSALEGSLDAAKEALRADGNNGVIASTADSTTAADNTVMTDPRPDNSHEADPTPKDSENVADKVTKLPVEDGMDVDEAADLLQVSVVEGSQDKEALEGAETGDAEGGEDQDDVPAPIVCERERKHRQHRTILQQVGRGLCLPTLQLILSYIPIT